MNLLEAVVGVDYNIKEIKTNDSELNSFLFSLGCYSGEKISVVRRLKGGLIVLIKNVKYNIDTHLAKAIIV